MDKQEFQKHLGKRIRAARILADMHQVDLAAKIRTNCFQLSRYECGKHSIRAYLLQEIARATGQPIEFFFPK